MSFDRMSALFVGGPKDGTREFVPKPPPPELRIQPPSSPTGPAPLIDPIPPEGRYVWTGTSKSGLRGVPLEARYEWRGWTDPPTMT